MDEFRQAAPPFDPSLTVFLHDAGVRVDLDYEQVEAIADMQAEIDRDPKAEPIDSLEWSISYDELIAFLLDSHRGSNGLFYMEAEDKSYLLDIATALETAAGRLRSACQESAPA